MNNHSQKNTLEKYETLKKLVEKVKMKLAGLYSDLENFVLSGNTMQIKKLNKTKQKSISVYIFLTFSKQNNLLYIKNICSENTMFTDNRKPSLYMK